MSEAAVMLFVMLFGLQTAIFYMLLRKEMMSRLHHEKPGGQDAVLKELAEIKEALNRLCKGLGREGMVNGQESAYQEDEFNQTCYSVLDILRQEGPSSSSQLSSKLGRSREHVSRLLKSLYAKGLVSRVGKPYSYMITERGMAFLSKREHGRANF